MAGKTILSTLCVLPWAAAYYTDNCSKDASNLVSRQQVENDLANVKTFINQRWGDWAIIGLVSPASIYGGGWGYDWERNDDHSANSLLNPHGQLWAEIGIYLCDGTDECAVDAADRVDCGTGGRDACLARGCCFNDAVPNTVWCFRKDGYISNPCPSSQCWNFDADANSCQLKAECSSLTCGATAIDISFSGDVFAVPDNAVPSFSNGAVATASGDQWTVSCPMGDHDMTYEIDQVAKTITFAVQMNVVGNNRLRSDIQDNVINLGAKSIVTTPYGVGVEFSCIYSLLVDVTSESYTVKDMSISDTVSATGLLTDGFTMTHADHFALGAQVEVVITWSVTGFSGLTFATETCTVSHGGTGVAIILDGCYSKVIGVLPGSGSDQFSDSFAFKAFKGTGEVVSEQFIECTVNICETGNCGKPTDNAQCPSDGDNALYMYSTDGN